jgi:Uma2 family endonuclease
MATVQVRRAVKKQAAPVPNRLFLNDVPWQTYEGLLEAFDKRRLRISFDRGELEIMTISSKHEEWKHLIALLIFVLAEELNQPIKGLGSTTFKSKEKKRGLEPDECYWLKNEGKVRKIDQYDPENHPPPDLVLEVDILSSSIDRIGIYESMRVREVWRCDGEKLEVRVLGAKGKYSVRENSGAFPGLKPAELIPFLKDASRTGEVAMVRAFRQWVRDKLVEGTLKLFGAKK